MDALTMNARSRGTIAKSAGDEIGSIADDVDTGQSGRYETGSAVYSDTFSVTNSSGTMPRPKSMSRRANAPGPQTGSVAGK